MRTKHLVILLIILALTLPASPAQAAGVVSVCDESHLKTALTGGGTVTFSCSGTITLTTSIIISANTTIDGSGQAVTISGNNAVRVFVVSQGVNLELDGLTIANGKSQGGYGGGIFHDGNTLVVNKCTFSGNRADAGGAGIYNLVGQVTVNNSIFSTNSSSQFGGAISNERTLTVNNTTFSGNSAGFVGGAIYNNGSMSVSNSTFSGNSAGTNGGGAIFSTDMATVNSSTFSGNTSSGNGGGIYHSGSLTVSNSTFSGNHAGNFGGAIAVDETLTIVNSTISGNSASSAGGGIMDFYGPVLMQNTIVANNTAGGNCVGFITDGGGNLSYPDKSCPGVNANPLLGPLQNNGGPTQTMALGTGSPAINAAVDAICAASPVNNRDQRGAIRPYGAHCDIGAVEQGAPAQPTPISIDIKPGSDPNSINCGNANGVIAVAILTTDTFDATTVDHTTVTFEGAGDIHVDKKTGEPRRHEEDVDGDGDMDLVFHFRLGGTSLTCASTEAALLGETFAGQPISGADFVRMVGGK